MLQRSPKMCPIYIKCKIDNAHEFCILIGQKHLTAALTVVPPEKLIHFGFYSNSEQADVIGGHSTETDVF